jgi:predicted RNA-binding Zn ribbon-like protein
MASAANIYQWVETLNGEPSRVLLYPIARAAGDLLVQGKFDRVKKCNNPDCILFLYDTTRSHTRQWCSMAACGNRIKVAAFYRRERAHR